MQNNFDTSFKLVIGHEGGFTRDPRDKGNWTTGRIGTGSLVGTKYGISAAAYPDLDIKNLSLEQAKAIYRKDYWTRAQCSSWPSGVDHLVFDIAVNSGVSRAVQLLQAAAKVKIDGIIGFQTRAAVNAKDPLELIIDLATHRDSFYARQNNATYEFGWFRRNNRVLIEAFEFVRGEY